MLDSVYKNGGFWIGRYEAGTSTARGASTDSIDNLIPTSKVNQYPFNYVTCSQAQDLASRIASADTNNNNNYHSSLMFGVQWDLVIKYLETSSGIWDTTGGKTATDYLKADSSTWGNYYNQPFDIDRGKYSVASPWNVFTDYTTATANKVTVTNGVSRKKGTTSSKRILLTTGASDTNSKKNIYDLAGNVSEWTLEHATSDTYYPCADRGGSFGNTGSYSPASYRGYYVSTTGSGSLVGFRSSLY